MPFEFEPTALPGVILIHTRSFEDERGYFMETYRDSQFAAAGIDERFVQTNLSYSRHGVVRGLHYQEEPHGQGKLVQAFRGAIYDVVVDVTPDSPRFGEWLAVELSAENRDMLYIPPQYAHGFCVLSDEALVFYAVTSEYNPQAERGVLWNDPSLGIPWPVANPIVSAKDQGLPGLEALKAASA